MKGKTFLVTVVLISLLFISPYVSSFSFDNVNYDFNNIVGYLIYDFKMITGMAGTSCTAPAYCDSTCSQSNQEPYSGTCIAPDICCIDISYCGDEVVDSGEECDYGSSNGEVCVPSPGFSCSYCDDSCQLVLVESSSCGDGTCDADETCSSCSSDCEGEQADCSVGQICEVVFGSGSCAVVEAPSACNNNFVEGLEVCDGSDLNSKTCITQGYNSGSLACNSNCLSFDTSGCSNVANDNEEDKSTAIPTTCASVNGVCSDKCINEFIHYGDTNFDRKCEIAYGEELVCCVPSYVASENEEIIDGTSGNVRNVEDYIIDESENVQTSPVNYNVENGLQGILLSPSYAMGGVWIVFGLTVFIIIISFYVHGRIFRKK
ncbi:hypothetical protein HN865_00685 [Candidatus Woesearchaeota archaeon]|jgi:hypothetical protein|nr:hypothetical protein [Candidatus Woesearchaeota archaeon]MBT7237355.1 hypothetical protein [Candidatus Woesearchaeota archaeon]